MNGSYKQTKTKRSRREVELIDPAIQWLQVQRLFTERLDTRRLKIMSRDNKKQFSEDVRLVFLNSDSEIGAHPENSVDAYLGCIVLQG